ncbi:LTA synthase family protein [Tumebacillus sp. DT12]|uniref:LTA synthase family protein n=1 Tax=Tumebacillus lacus TaxID=2995335 RepID=A0ABT3X3A0_9BACL|nr:LTA synthase family protein [Tumebacillus lacus]MCX7570443.1 LTA synthase family protein [Tumebacillus lacus]
MNPLPLFSPARALKWIKAHREIVCLNLLLLIKVTCLSLGFGSGYASPFMLVATLASLFLLSSCLLLLPRQRRMLGLVCFDLLLTTALLADSLFFNYFEHVIPLVVVRQAGQIGGVADSVLALFTKKEFLLYADFLLLVPLALRRRRRHRSEPVADSHLPWTARFRQATAVFVGSACVLAAQYGAVAETGGSSAFRDLYGNDTVLRRLGLINYHVADLYHMLESKPAILTSNDVAVLKTYMKVKRNSNAPYLHGAAQGQNLILIQLEAFQSYLLNTKIGDQEITPHLNQLVKESLYFDDYHPQVGDGNTSDAEFMTLNSLFPQAAGITYNDKHQNALRSLPKLLRDKGYQTAAFHNYIPTYFQRNQMYPNEGFDRFYNASTFRVDESIGMGLSDGSMYRQSLPLLREMKQPFFSFFVSLTGHWPYTLPDDKKELTIPESSSSKILRKYVHVQHYADRALGEFLTGLKRDGLLDRSLLVIYGDHHAKGPDEAEMARLKGITKPFDDQLRLEMRKVPLLIHFPKGEHAGVSHITAGQMDLLPTVANLLGIERERMFYFGQDLLNAKTGHAAFRNHTEPGTFFTEDLFYHAGKDGLFAHGTCRQRRTGAELPLDRCAPVYKKAKWDWQMSDLILEQNSLPRLLGK